MLDKFCATHWGSLFWSLSCLLVDEGLHLFLSLWTLPASVSECHAMEKTGRAVSHCLGLCIRGNISPLNPLSRKDVLCRNSWRYLCSLLALLVFQSPVRDSLLRCQVKWFKRWSPNLSQLCCNAHVWYLKSGRPAPAKVQVGQYPLPWLTAGVDPQGRRSLEV